MVRKEVEYIATFYRITFSITQSEGEPESKMIYKTRMRFTAHAASTHIF